MATATIDIALTTKAQQIAEKRTALLCDSWQKQLSEIPKDTIDKDSLASEDFFDLVLRAWEATKRTRSSEKIELYARVLTGATVFQDREEYVPEEYLATLEELSVREIEVARALYDQQGKLNDPSDEIFEVLKSVETNYSDKCKITPRGLVVTSRGEKGHGQWSELHRSCPQVKKEDIEYILLRLQRSGLVNEVSGTITDYFGGVFVITETFRKMMAYLERNPH